jgi:hypothetical protein
MRESNTRIIRGALIGRGRPRARARLVPAVAAVLALAGHALAAHAARGAADCDRQCLDQTVDRYLDALVAHDPTQVKIAPGAKFVENTKPTPIGEGLWKSASAAPTTFKLYVPDPVAQQVGFIGVMQEGGMPIQLALRLQLDHGRIVEIEHLIARNLRPNMLANLQTPRPAIMAAVPPAERSSREQLLKIGASYYDALTTGNGHAAPFADDCVRHENGMQTNANQRPTATPIGGSAQDSRAAAMSKIGAMGCEAQIDTHTFDYIKRIEPRRVWIADPQTGLVFGLSQFRHPMKEDSVKIVGVPGVESMPMKFQPFDLPAAHIFKVRDGKIHEIEAMGFTMPYDSKTGWEQ